MRDVLAKVHWGILGRFWRLLPARGRRESPGHRWSGRVDDRRNERRNGGRHRRRRRRRTEGARAEAVRVEALAAAEAAPRNRWGRRRRKRRFILPRWAPGTRAPPTRARWTAATRSFSTGSQCARNWQIAFTAPASGLDRAVARLPARGGGRIFWATTPRTGNRRSRRSRPEGRRTCFTRALKPGSGSTAASLVYSENAALFTIPRSGGPPDPGVVYATNRYDPRVFYRALDAHFVYWFQHDTVRSARLTSSGDWPATVASRSCLFSFTEAEVRQKPMNGIQVLGDQVLVYGRDMDLHPLTPGPSRRGRTSAALCRSCCRTRAIPPHAGYTTLLGVSDDGALLWTRPSRR